MPLTDHNTRAQSKESYKKETVNSDVTPICQCGQPMVYDDMTTVDIERNFDVL